MKRKVNKFTNRTISFVLAICLVLTSVDITPLKLANAQETNTSNSKTTGIAYDSNEVARYNDYPVYKRENVYFPFTYYQYGTNYGDYYYSDGYFADDANTTTNKHIYTTSIHMAVAAFNSNYYGDYGNGPKRVLDFMSKNGFGNTSANSDYYITPTANTIGVAAGYKYVKEGDYYVIAAAIRGGDYESEWISNVTLGTSDNAAGFQAAADKVVNSFLYDYVENNSTLKNAKDKIKVWITGFSRGAAVANLSAKMLSEKYGTEDVFGYCFATPQGALNDGKTYNNIRNVVYNDDMVPKLAPSYMNFIRYGQTLYYSNSTLDMEKYTAELKKFSPSTTLDDNFQQATFHVLNSVQGGNGFNPTPTGSKQTQEEYLNTVLSKIKEWGIVPSRNDYSTKVIEGAATYEKTFSVLADIMLNSSNPNLLNALTNSFSDLDAGKYYTLWRMITLGSESMPFEDNNFLGFTTLFSNGRKSVYDAIWKNFNNKGGTNGLSETQKSDLKKVWYAVCRLAIDFIYNDSGGGGNATNLGTFMYNSDRIQADHLPQKYLAFLRLDDSYYQGGNATITYQTNNSNYTAEKQTTLVGTTPVAPRTINHERFLGWYLDEQCTQAYDPLTYNVEGDFTLYARWKKYTNAYSWNGEYPSSVSAPVDNNEYANETEANAALDTTFTKETRVNGKKGDKFGTWTFDGWQLSSSDTTNLVTTYTGSWSFKEDEYRVEYNWGDKVSQDYPSSVTLPTNDSVYNTEDEAKESVDTTFSSSSKTVAMKGEVSGEWTFSGWTGSITNDKTKVVTFYGSWVFEANPEIYDLYLGIEGEYVYTHKITQGTTINLSDYNPQPREGYIFDGWYKDTFVTKASNTQPVRSSMIFLGRWIKQTSVVYDWGTDAPTSQTLPQDSKLYDTSDLAKNAVDTSYNSQSRLDEEDGYWVFSGWDSGSLDSENAILTFKGTWTYLENKNVTLFIDNAQDGIEAERVISVKQNSALSLDQYTPANGEKYTFDGWYINGLGDKLNTLNVGSSDVTLKGRIVNKYTLSYQWSSDSSIPDGQVLPINDNYYDTELGAKGALDQTLTDTTTFRGTKDGESGTWKFSGWYDSGINEQTNVITYKGTWFFEEDVVNYTITFKGEGVDAAESAMEFRKNTKVDLTDFMPYRDGYSFEGWYDRDGSDGNWGNLISEVTVTSDLTVYAKWKVAEVTYKLTYISQGTPYNQESLPTLPKGQKWNAYNFVPERSGYTFEGWYYDEALNNKVTGLVTMDSDKSLYAKWINNTTGEDSSTEQPQITISSYAGTGSLIINGTTVKSGDTLSYTPGQALDIRWCPAKAGSNVTLIKSLKVAGQEISPMNAIDKSQWQLTNSAYRKKMNDSSAQMATFDAIVNTEHQLEVSTSNNVTALSIEVEFAEYTPVYRLYNMITSEHLFTTNKAEYDNFVKLCNEDKDVWIGEGIDWFAEIVPSVANENTVRRFYNADLGAMGRSSHYYSKDEAEIATLLQNGWVDDGVDNYIQSSGSVAIWTCYNEQLGSAHHYTSNRSEWESLDKYGWALENDKNGSLGVFQAIMSAKP